MTAVLLTLHRLFGINTVDQTASAKTLLQLPPLPLPPPLNHHLHHPTVLNRGLVMGIVMIFATIRRITMITVTAVATTKGTVATKTKADKISALSVLDLV